jgi:pimeloyl-ACP methyl ester carboxylesterase
VLRGYRSSEVDTSEGRVHVLEGRGRGPLPTTVLLHGFGSAGVHYSPLLRALRGDVSRLLVPDFLAHGFSARPPGPMTTERLIGAMREALDDRIGDEKAIVFGNSMGGYGALRYALASPHKVAALVLCSPAGTFRDVDQVRAIFDMHGHADALRFLDRLFARPPALRHLIAWDLKQRFRRPELLEILEDVDERYAITPEHLAQLEVPVLLLWGTADRVLPRSHFEFYRENLPGHAKVEELEALGHSPYLEGPQVVASKIMRFLETELRA